MLRHRKKLFNFYNCLILGGITFALVHIFQPNQHSPTKNDLLQSDYVEYDEYSCNCPRLAPLVSKYVENGGNQSFCSDWATSLGEGQKVVSYSLYGDHANYHVSRKYYKQIEERLKEVDYYYKGWRVRLYHNTSQTDNYTSTLICNLYCKYTHFDPCLVGRIYIPNSWNNITFGLKDENYKRVFSTEIDYFKNIDGLRVLTYLKDFLKTSQLSRTMNSNKQKSTVNDFSVSSRQISLNKVDLTTQPINEKVTVNNYTPKDTRSKFENYLIPKMWRFLAMADPLVSEFLIRDVDSFILPREVAAVEQWLQNSSAVLHSMRDHPSHNGVILAGLWGGSRTRGSVLLTELLQGMMKWPMRNLWDYDQILLRRVVWPQVLDTMLVHDSYHCGNPNFKSHHRSLPFPTQRKERLFVSWGPERSKTELRDLTPCPKACRPRDHPDWTYC